MTVISVSGSSAGVPNAVTISTGSLTEFSQTMINYIAGGFKIEGAPFVYTSSGSNDPEYAAFMVQKKWN